MSRPVAGWGGGAPAAGRGRRRGGAAAAAVVLALAGLLGALGAKAERLIRYEHDALTVRLTNVPVAEVLDELRRQTGAEIRGQPHTPGAVTAEFAAVPLGEALHRLLGEQNFALVFADGGRLKAVRLLGEAEGLAAAPPAGAAPPAPARTTPPQVAAADLATLLARHAPVPVAGRLAPLLGASSASFAQLVDLTLHQDDADVRAEALTTAVSTLEMDPTLLAAVVDELDTVDDGALHTLFGNVAGEHAEEIAMLILTQARANELRVKASSILQQLRAGS